MSILVVLSNRFFVTEGLCFYVVLINCPCSQLCVSRRMAFPVKDVLRITITGAAGQIGYSLVPMVARGLMLGPLQRLELRLLDIEPAQKILEGLRMELEDCNLPLLTGTVITSNPSVAFDRADILIMCGAFPRKPGMERKDLLQINAKIFSEQGKIIASVAEPHCRILVVGNPANTNALILLTAAEGKIPRTNVTALTRLDHNRALAQAALSINAPTGSVRNVIIWGNHSGTQVPDVNSALIGSVNLRQEAGKDSYFDGPFIQCVQQRGAEVMKARGFSSAASAAQAIVDHVHDWILGTEPGKFVSMAVISDSNPYSIPENLIFSFPTTCANGQWSIVPHLQITPLTSELIKKTTDELLEEREQAF